MTAWFVGNLVTGQITNYLPVKSGSWSTELNGAGSVTVTMPLSDPDVAALQLRNLATVGETFLGVAENGVVMNAGPIWNHSYLIDDQTLEITAKGLMSVFERRTVMPAVPTGVSDPAGYDTYLQNVDSGTVVKQIIQQAIQVNGGQLPVALPADVGGVQSPTYYGEDFTLVSEAVGDIIDKGVDVDLAPQFSGDGLAIFWLLRTGTDTAPQLTNANPVNPPLWDMSVPHASIKSLQVQVDASRLAGRVWETTGSSGGSLYSRVDNKSLTSQGYPLLETVDSSHTDVEDQPVLDRIAAEAARVSSRPTELWSFQVRAAEQPLAGSYRVGDSCVIRVGADPYIGRGDYSRRITNLSGDQDGKWVSVTTGQTYSLTG